MVKPDVSGNEDAERPYLELKQVRHPCVQRSMEQLSASGKKFIPSDCHMGTPRILLITGPNMGGKSTLLRMTCIATIMAQIGCFVPAESCRMTVVDRVFTRLGASDRILENKSTFFVELEETKAICELATPNSLVIMDELGRGTSTFDGYSLANAVLKYLVQHVNCRTLFTTHYHMLVHDFKQVPEKIGLYVMASTTEEGSGDVQFLYRFEQGVAERSHGLFIAKLAGVPESVLRMAEAKSIEFNDKLEGLTKRIGNMALQ